MQIKFTVEKETKNTIRFKEQASPGVDTSPAAPAIGSLYVSKATLKTLGYSDGKDLVVTLAVSK